jgi:hypothetical protein
MEYTGERYLAVYKTADRVDKRGDEKKDEIQEVKEVIANPSPDERRHEKNCYQYRCWDKYLKDDCNDLKKAKKHRQSTEKSKRRHVM